VTGPPGAGKSTLVDKLISEIRPSGRTVAVIAVDPTSPFTGGAVLGDRLRMQTHGRDEGVFIRSMATRGHVGGLARATSDAALILDAAGKDLVLVETVGVGQDEIDIVRTADVSIVTLVPGLGDDVQALKAGLMEIADIFVVNKADREGADRLVSAIEATLSLRTYRPDEWRPPVLKTVAASGTGITTVLQTVEAFRAHATAAKSSVVPRASGTTAGASDDTIHAARRRARCSYHLRELLVRRFLERFERETLTAVQFEEAVDRVAARELDPYTAAEDLLRVPHPRSRAPLP
jgi:LAO/AO transport system kinase